jgi:hypothetical protein
MDPISFALRKIPSDVDKDRAKSLFNSAANLPAHNLSVSTGKAASFLGLVPHSLLLKVNVLLLERSTGMAKLCRTSHHPPPGPFLGRK